MTLFNRICASGLALMLFGATITSAQSEDRHVRIINRASSAIRYLYASNVDSQRWEEDILGPFNVILPDHYVDANIDDGTGHCLYDLKAVLYDSRVAIMPHFNVCTQSSWTVSD